MLVRHKVADFEKWKSVYENHRPAREAAGLKDLYFWRNEDDASEVIKVSDAAKVKAFSGSADAQEKMHAAGIQEPPEVVFLSGNKAGVTS
jgi:hypothetical protein